MLLDMCYLQQDAFDAVDASMSRERQKKSFELLSWLIDSDYRFEDKEAVRDFFTRLTVSTKTGTMLRRIRRNTPTTRNRFASLPQRRSLLRRPPPPDCVHGERLVTSDKEICK